jgi:hypothetical protein
MADVTTRGPDPCRQGLVRSRNVTFVYVYASKRRAVMTPIHKKSDHFASVARLAILSALLRLESSNTGRLSLGMAHTADPMSVNFT